MNLSGNDLASLFKRCHFDSTIIIVCVRWYITYKLSYRDLVAIMAERDVDVAHTGMQPHIAVAELQEEDVLPADLTVRTNSGGAGTTRTRSKT
jgi:hypothetical protein